MAILGALFIGLGASLVYFAGYKGISPSQWPAKIAAMRSGGSKP